MPKQQFLVVLCGKQTEVVFPHKGYVLNYDSQFFTVKKVPEFHWVYLLHAPLSHKKII